MNNVRDFIFSLGTLETRNNLANKYSLFDLHIANVESSKNEEIFLT